MKFYIAATVSRYQEHNLVRDFLQKAGHKLTYDWTQHGNNGDLSGMDAESRTRYAHLEIQALKHADFVVVLIPGGNGTNSEVGMAAVLGKRTYLHSFTPEKHFGPEMCINNFYWHLHAKRNSAKTLEDFTQWVLLQVAE